MQSIEKSQFQKLLNRNVLFPLFFGFLSVIFFVGIISYLMSLARWVEKSDTTINAANIMLKLIVDQETAMRGFVITRDDDYLAPYRSAADSLPDTIEKLRRTIGGDATKIRRLDLIADAYRQWHEYAENVIERRSKGSEIREVIGPQGKQLMDQIRNQGGALLAELADQRAEHSANARTFVVALVGGFLALSLLLSGVLAQLGRRQMIHMASSYEKLLRDLDLQNAALHDEEWLRIGELGLAEQIIGQLPLPILCQNVLAYLARRIDVIVGALYVSNGDDNFRREANYGFAKAFAQRDQQFARGEGLVGQAAAENRILSLRDAPSDYLKVNSGIGEAAPVQVLLVPIRAETAIVAVLELGFFRQVEQRDFVFMERIAENIGAAIVAAIYRRRLHDALLEMQQLNDELQTQQAELQSANEELEAQSKILAESQERLESQHAELEEVNQALQDNNEILRTTRNLLEQRALQLEQASRYKSEFLANMSHELRTPLNSALILSKLLADNAQQNLTEEQVRFATAIHSAGKDLLALINDVLDLSKVEAGKIDIAPGETPIALIVETLRTYFEPLAREKDLQFTVQIDESVPPTIRTDRQRLEQILRNLLSNAFKFTTFGAVRLSVMKSAGEKLAFAVSDSGIGISVDRHDLIFEPFHQIDSASNRKYGGAGLGLSISRDLARLLGGMLAVDSKPGEGSIFTLTIPIEFSEAVIVDALPSMTMGREQRSPMHARIVREQFTRQNSIQGALAGEYFTGEQLSDESLTVERFADGQFGGEQFSGEQMTREQFSREQFTHEQFGREKNGREHIGQFMTGETLAPVCDFTDDRETLSGAGRVILVVEDEIQFARILYDLAHESGFDCLVATTAEEAFELAVRYRPAAIMLDMKLPDHSGLSVLARLKEEPRTRHVPVHVLSVEERSSVALRMGAISYTLKPITHEQLRELFAGVERNLDGEVKSVLIVEDFSRHEENTARLIAGTDVTTTTVAMGEQALRLLRERTFDCVITDYELPDMPASELLTRMANTDIRAKPPVIVNSARNLNRDEERELLRHSHSMIIKGVCSQERLLDETTLFLHRAEADFSDEKQSALRDYRGRNRAFENRTILIVDDDVRNIFALTSVLEGKGAKIAVARNGYEAIDRLNEIAEIDLVLMDIMMPEMDGYEAMEKIRLDRRFAKLPIIAVTAKAMRDDLERCLRAGASDYVAKPINLDRLVSLIRAWLPQVQRI